MAIQLFSRTSTMGFSGRKLRVFFTCVATLGFSLFGYDQGLMSGLLSGEQFNKEFPPTGAKMIVGGKEVGEYKADVNGGAVTACYEIGCLFGALFAMFQGDKFGRKPLVVVGSFIIIVGAVISTAAFGPQWGLGQFVLGRVITGIGNGMNTATIPVWQSEMSKAENRGMLVNFEGSVIAVGTFVAYWIDFGFSYINTSVQWRFPVAFQIFFAIFLFLGATRVPESPRWLLAHDHKTEGLQVLGALNGLGPEHDEVYAEYTVINDSINRFSKNQAGIKDLFSGGKQQYFARMVIGSSGQFFQQFTGCNAAIYYSTILFEKTIHLDHRLSLILGGVFSTVYALSTIPSFFLVDTLGRRNLFLIGALGQGLSLTITFACLIPDDGNNTETAKGAAVGLFLFIIFFGFTILPMPWIYPPEINPMRTRTIASAVSTCTNWLTNFAVVMFTPVFVGASGYGCYLFFAVMNFLFVPIIFFFYPETAGRSLEEIDIIFAKAHVDGRLPFRVAATMPRLSLKDIEEHNAQLGLDDDFDKDKIETQENASTTSLDKSNERTQSPDELFVKQAEV